MGKDHCVSAEQHSVAVNLDLDHPSPRRGLISREFGLSELLSPVVGQATVCRAGDRILINPRCGGKETRGEIKGGVGGSCRDDDAAALNSRQLFKVGQQTPQHHVRFQLDEKVKLVPADVLRHSPQRLDETRGGLGREFGLEREVEFDALRQQAGEKVSTAAGEDDFGPVTVESQVRDYLGGCKRGVAAGFPVNGPEANASTI